MIELSGAGIQSSWEIEIAPKLPFNQMSSFHLFTKANSEGLMIVHTTNLARVMNQDHQANHVLSQATWEDRESLQMSFEVFMTDLMSPLKHLVMVDDGPRKTFTKVRFQQPNENQSGCLNVLLGYPVWIPDEGQFRFVALDKESSSKTGQFTALNFKVGKAVKV